MLKLPIDLNEAHHSDHVVTVDEPRPAWGETEFAYKATRPHKVDKDVWEKQRRVPVTPLEVEAKPRPGFSLCPRSSTPMTSLESHKPIEVYDPSGRD